MKLFYLLFVIPQMVFADLSLVGSWQAANSSSRTLRIVEHGESLFVRDLRDATRVRLNLFSNSDWRGLFRFHAVAPLSGNRVDVTAESNRRRVYEKWTGSRWQEYVTWDWNIVANGRMTLQSIHRDNRDILIVTIRALRNQFGNTYVGDIVYQEEFIRR